MLGNVNRPNLIRGETDRQMQGPTMNVTMGWTETEAKNHAEVPNGLIESAQMNVDLHKQAVETASDLWSRLGKNTQSIRRELLAISLNEIASLRHIGMWIEAIRPKCRNDLRNVELAPLRHEPCVLEGTFESGSN